jgi:hypothetical protein
MKKLILILAVLWFGLNAFANSVKADDYSKAVIGHVIQSKVNGTDVDVNALMSYELEKLAPLEIQVILLSGLTLIILELFKKERSSWKKQESKRN